MSQMPVEQLTALAEGLRGVVSGDGEVSHFEGPKLEVMMAIGSVAGDGDDCLIAVAFDDHEGG